MKAELQQKARELRRQGWSVRQITNVLGVSKSSISLWTRDIELTEQQRLELRRHQRQFGELNIGSRTNQERNLKKRLSFQQAGRMRAKEGNPLHQAGCMLYWAEGAKGRNGIYFVNSDSNMIKLFVRFLREEFGVQNKALAIRIHCHTYDEQEIKRIERYWCDLLNLPLTCVKKTYIKDGGSSRSNRLENGVCDIRVHSTEIVQHIFGAIQEYAGFDNPAWLF